MYGYIYKTTNLVNGKIYVGQHKAAIFEPNNYMGSGKILHSAIQKYGIDAFRQELIEWCETKEALDSREIFWIKELNAQDPAIGYNITDGGFGGCSFRTEETKQKIGTWNKNKILINNGRSCIKIGRDDLDKYLKLGYSVGCLPFTRTEADKQKKAKAQTGHVAMSKGEIKTWATADQVNNLLADGYVIGWGKKLPQKKTIGEKAPFRFMSKDGICHKVSCEFWDNFIANGWRFGNSTDRRNKPVICYETKEEFSSIIDVLNSYPKASVLKRCLKLGPEATCCGCHWYFKGDDARAEQIKTILESHSQC